MASHAGGGLKSWGVYSEIPGATNNNIIATWDSERSTKLDAVDDNALTCKFGEADPSDITMLDLPLAKRGTAAGRDQLRGVFLCMYRIQVSRPHMRTRY